MATSGKERWPVLGLMLAIAVVLPVARALADENVLMEYSLEELSNLRVETDSKTIEPLDRASSTIYVVTEQDIKTYGYRNLADILENVPGVQTSNLGFFLQGGQRGLVGNFAQTLLLINGREVSSLTTQEALIGDQFGVDNIRQVEVMNSPASALYGANAYSGVINILTKDSSPDFGGQEVRYEQGSQGTRGLSLISRHYVGDKGISLYYRQYQSDNWDFGNFVADTTHFSAGFPQPAQAAAASAGDDYLNRSNAHSWAVRAEAHGFYLGTDGYTIDSGKGLETVALDYNSQRDHREMSLWYGGWKGRLGAFDVETEYQQLRDKLWGLNYEFRYDTWQQLLNQGRSPTAPLTQAEIYGPFQYVYSQENSPGSIRHRGYVQARHKFSDSGSLTMGLVAEYSDLLGEALDNADLSPPFNTTVSSSNPMHNPLYRSHKQSAYVQWRDSYWSQRVDLTLGARVDHQSHYGEVHNFRGGLVYHAGPDTHWRLSYGEAFREPNIFELGDFNPPTSSASDDLMPASIRTTELGLVRQLSSNQRLQVTAFEEKAHGAILPTATATFANANEETHGLEVLYGFRSGRWRMDTAYTWMHTGARQVGDRKVDTLNVYPNRLSWGGGYMPAAHWRLGFRANYYSRMNAEAGNPQVDAVLKVPAAVRLDANIRYLASWFDVNDTELALSIHNLFNRRYYQPNLRNTGPAEFLQPGRQVLASVTLDY